MKTICLQGMKGRVRFSQVTASKCFVETLFITF